MLIDLNCDMGESFGRYTIGQDSEILNYVSACNIACGFHAGDPKIIIDTIKEAYLKNVKIGAHPSYPDLQGFGRRRMHITSDELVPIIQYQISALDKLSQIHGDGLHHVKPHGALYNHAYDDENVAKSIAAAFLPWRDSCVLYAQYGSALSKIAEDCGIKVMIEGFADRRYDDDMNLRSRNLPGAVHDNIEDMIAQVVKMVKDEKIQTPTGEKDIQVQTICIHGDHPKAINIVKQLSKTLIDESIGIG